MRGGDAAADVAAAVVWPLAAWPLALVGDFTSVAVEAAAAGGLRVAAAADAGRFAPVAFDA
jgi:hypothetical protein